MKSINTPAPIPVPFGAAADPTTINVIPVPSQQGITPGAASYEDGFPITTFQDPDAGGVAPRGSDFNGILNAITQSLAWIQSGGQFVYNGTFSGNVSGYPKGAILQRSDLTGGWISTQDDNTNNPDTGGAGWLPYGGSTTPQSIVVDGSDITLTALQAASNVLVITGTLSANVSIFLPAWNGAQWLVVNNTGVSAFTLTITTAGGTGVTISDPSLFVVGDGTNINPASPPGLADAPADGNIYGRKDNEWVVAVAGSPLTNPMTTPGDMIYGTTAGNPLRLPIGTNGWVLTVVAGLPVWQVSTTGFTNPMSAVGDLILGGASGAAGRLGIGSNTFVLTSNGTTAGWAAAVGFANPMNAIGQIIYGGTSGTPTALAAGTSGLFLKSNGGAAPSWAAALANPMTAANDIIVGGTSGAPARLAIGAANSVLAFVSGAIAWTSGALLGVANVFTNVQAVTPYRANISGAVSIDLAATAKSNNLHLTLNGNVTSFAVTNPVDGAVYNFRFIQDATGSRTFSGFPSSFKFSGGTAPIFSTAANAVDFMSCEYGSTEGTFMCSFLPGMA